VAEGHRVETDPVALPVDPGATDGLSKLIAAPWRSFDDDEGFVGKKL
jgi:hypothetical protein